MTNQTILFRQIKYDVACYLNNGNPKEKALGIGYGMINELEAMQILTDKQAERLRRRLNYWIFNLYKPYRKDK